MKLVHLRLAAAVFGLGALVLAHGRAQSETIVCAWGDGYLSCADNPNSGAKIVHVPRPMSDEEARESERRDAAWVARCRPVVVPDRYGVGRYRYSAEGCEYGRWR